MGILDKHEIIHTIARREWPLHWEFRFTNCLAGLPKFRDDLGISESRNGEQSANCVYGIDQVIA